MKNKVLQLMSLLLAAMLQMAPLVRYLLPAEGLAPSAWSIILKIGVGATALLGFDAVSQASSISISPPNATVGVPYSGTITYSGGHSGSVGSMSYSNNCIGVAYPFLDGLNIVYNGGNTASVSGTPTNNSTYTFSVEVWDGSGCGGGHNDTRSAVLVVGTNSSTAVKPVVVPSPLNPVCAQVGSTVLLSGTATGSPIPSYQWWLGGATIPGATNATLIITNVQLTNANSYTLTASNSTDVGENLLTLPNASATLSVCISGGTNFSVYDYTNYAPAGVPLTMYSYFTNVAGAANYYTWAKGSPLSTSNTYALANPTPVSSGIYNVKFFSTNALGTSIMPTGQNYDSIWSFGYIPVFTNSLPPSTNVNAGTTVTFNINIRGNLDVYYPGAQTTNTGVSDVFWYQGNTLVAAQSYYNGPLNGPTFSNYVAIASLTLNSVTPANAGSYTVVATNFWGSTTSSPVVLSVTGSGYAPVITTNLPLSLGLLSGQSSIISITVTGTPPFAYQWRTGGVNLVNGSVYAGTTTNSLTLTAATTGNSGNYTVAVTNISGAITSSVTAVTVASPPQVNTSGNTPGSLQLNGNTVTDLTYVVLRSTNLSAPNWTPVITNNTGSAGTINYPIDTTGNPSGFYRIDFP